MCPAARENQQFQGISDKTIFLVIFPSHIFLLINSPTFPMMTLNIKIVWFCYAWKVLSAHFMSGLVSPVSICNKCSFWAKTWKFVHVRFESKYFILIWLMVVTSFAYCEIILERFYLKIEPCFIPFHVPTLTYSNIWFGIFTISKILYFEPKKAFESGRNSWSISWSKCFCWRYSAGSSPKYSCTSRICQNSWW